jgi:CubicO group peptidase (beta-lactamase class C family)
VWEYSVSIDVLGILLERVTQQSLGDILAERIWKPLEPVMDLYFDT